MKRAVLTVAVVLLAISCTSDEPDEAAVRADTVSQSARDSAVARSGLPGASGVSRAQDASAAAAERAARIDSIRP